MKITDSKFVGSYPRHDLAPTLGVPQIAVGGKSNVGKSSLINSLLNRKNLARISKDPGKTRQLNLFVIEGSKSRPLLSLMDLPGYGYARVSASMRNEWQTLIEGYLQNAPELRGFLLLIDSRRFVEDREIQLIDYLVYWRRPVCPVLTKADKLNRSQSSRAVRMTAELLRRYEDSVHAPILHSSKDGTGNDLIWRWISERINDESQ